MMEKERMSKNRELTELAFLKAIDDLIEEDGFENLGVNAVAAKAGLSKMLIYRYFESLDGLIVAYIQRNDYWINLEPELPDVAHLGDFVKKLFRDQITMLRDSYTLRRLYRWELSAKNKVIKELRERREAKGIWLIEAVSRLTNRPKEDIAVMATVLTSSITYLVLLEENCPVYNGFKLQSETGWEQLEKELMPPVEKKIYPYRKWMMAAAAIIILAVVSSVSLYFLGTPAADEIRHIQTPALASTPDALPGVQQPDMQGTAVEPVLRPVTREDRLAKVDRNHTEQKTGVDPLGIGNGNKLSTGNGEDSLSEEDKNVKGNGETENVKDEPKQAENTDVSQGQSQDTERSNNRPRRPSGKDKLHIPTEKRSSQKGTWSMGLSVGNSGGASTEVGAGSHAYMSRVSMLSVSNGLMETIPNDQTLVFEDGVPYLRQAKQVVDIKHHQPISFGLSVRKGLAKGFSLETGLTYTLLSSDAKLAGEEQQIEQKLHYIGIPLRANWNFLDKKLVTLYVSGGGMVEKCVYGKLGSEKETVKPLQFSVSGGVGAQINATKRLGIYVEPGVAYYFNDGSDIQTIRKENPFNFNIQAGVRLTY